MKSLAKILLIGLGFVALLYVTPRAWWFGEFVALFLLMAWKVAEA